MNERFIAFEGVRKSYDGASYVVRGLDLDVARGEFLTLLGPSGSGKTTTLMMLAGFEAPTHGAIMLGGERIDSVPPHRRNIGVVFQNYALFPAHDSRREHRLPSEDAPARQGRGDGARAPRARHGAHGEISRRGGPTSFRAASSSASRSPALSCSSRSSC